MNIVKIDQYSIEYILEGNPKNMTLVFAHGLGASVGQWTDQLIYFKEKYQVLAFSLQGHGNSSVGHPPESYSLESYGDVAIKLLKKLNINTCIWVGCSMGGVVGYEVIKQDKSVIRSLVSFGTTPKLRLSKFFLSFIRFMDNAMIKMMGFESYVAFASKSVSKKKDVQEAMKRIMIQAEPQAIIESHVMLGNYDYLKIIEESKTPLFIIKAPFDKGINKEIKKNVSFLSKSGNVSIVEINGAGHVANLDQPEGFNNILMKIIS
ncbi:MAG: alpha/beta hydrolase [Spirochaetales bacterium]|nr:alpha/beta hydrolase [Spirochaetales bacterium]